MEIVRKIEEKIDVGKSIDICGLNINNENYTLHVINDGSNLVLKFLQNNEAQFDITIKEDQLNFLRLNKRLSHDHDDVEYCLKRKNEKNNYFWDSRFPYSYEDNDFFTIPFGKHTTDY